MIRRAVLCATAMLFLGAFAAPPITGAGSTFVEPALSKWIADEATTGGPPITYRAVGSGAGIELVRSHKVDFGASDKPLTPDELRAADLAQFPIVIGGVVPVVNLPGIEPGELHLTGPLLAQIYLGKITHWNDPAIVALNRTLKLPNAAILTVHRSDGSGTTFNWANYLSKVSAEWKARVGDGTAVEWPVGEGEPGNDGVAARVRTTRYAIGYVEFAFVARHQLTWTTLVNRAGHEAKPEVFSFQAAAKGVPFRADHDFYALLTDAGGDYAYPIAATTFILVPKHQDPARTRAVIRFFDWALDHGRESATHLGYVPLPRQLTDDVRAYWAQQLTR
jgi:phosphate transport system substrate-binding protein